jgi:hypothetical protein
MPPSSLPNVAFFYKANFSCDIPKTKPIPAFGILVLFSKGTLMATSVQFDTLAYAKQLQIAGVPKEQAEAQSEVLAVMLSKAVASPNDLENVERSLMNEIASAVLKVENRMTAMAGEITLLKWMAATSIGLSLAILLKLFVH